MYCKTSVSHRPVSLYAFIFLFPLILIMVFYSNALSVQVTLTWDPNTEPDLAGYQMYYGTSSGIYTGSIDVNNLTTCTISDLEEDHTYYFAVTAYNTSGDESDFSNEVFKYFPNGTPPPPPPPDGETPQFEIGEVSIDHNWVEIKFRESFSDPVVIAKPPRQMLFSRKSIFSK